MDEELRRALLKELASEGGKKRAADLGPERCSEIAAKAAKKRWKGHKPKRKSKKPQVADS